jgi:hypothetical protein
MESEDLWGDGLTDIINRSLTPVADIINRPTEPTPSPTSSKPVREILIAALMMEYHHTGGRGPIDYAERLNSLDDVQLLTQLSNAVELWKESDRALYFRLQIEFSRAKAILNPPKPKIWMYKNRSSSVSDSFETIRFLDNNHPYSEFF